MIDRIKYLVESKGLRYSRFADEIGVKRASISHIFNGRNQPSLGFVQKILQRYPEVDAGWLLMGDGQAPEEIPEEKEAGEEAALEFSEGEEATSGTPREENKAIDRIVIFYADGTFVSYSGK